jgi:FMN phosphatase YigB (HAD superfamily)
MEIMALSPSTEITTLLWDLDGTIVRMKRRGLELRFMWRAIRRFWGAIPPWRFRRAFWRAVEEVQAHRTPRTNYEVMLASLERHARRPIGEIARRFVAEDFPALADRFEPIPGARETLLRARDLGYRLVLATNPLWPREAVLRRLEWGGAGDVAFDFVSHSETMTRCKPNVEYYRELLERIGARGSECLMIGNDARKDLPAREVGIATFLVGIDGTYEDLQEWMKCPSLSA